MLTDGRTDAGQNVMTKAHLQNEGELKNMVQSVYSLRSCNHLDIVVNATRYHLFSCVIEGHGSNLVCVFKGLCTAFFS